MTRLFLDTWTMPGAEIGPENPLTPLSGTRTASAGSHVRSGGDYPDRGNEGAMLPYRLQDNYTRQRRPMRFKTAVLENQTLRATFLLEMGGRLWSLFHKPRKRELLFVNSVFQPANLALRDAWFSGGVEWNYSVIAHSALTCSPVFAARVEGEDGAPILRLYEFDRIRRIPWQLDFILPVDSPVLLVRGRLDNPNDHAIPMWWWSNTAVDERPGVRVLAPADSAYRRSYDGDTTTATYSVPVHDGTDVTYPASRTSAGDLYFRIAEGHRPWVAALDQAGMGLVHASTRRLFGRKVFFWGSHRGGTRWQEFLNGPGQRYIEIQGGMGRTQGEYVTMPARDRWEWLEAYGLMEADPATVHGAHWPAAWGAVERQLDRTLTIDEMDATLERTAATADRTPAELLQRGSGWGALEHRRQQAAGERPFASDALPFPDDTLGPEQAPWLHLLEHARLPQSTPDQPPISLMVQPQWRQLLERSATDGPDAHNWLAWYHLGVMRYRAGDRDTAGQAWQRSLEIAPSPWALRDLAVLARERDDRQAAADLSLRAVRLAPHLVPLTIECAQTLLQAGRNEEQIQFIDSLPPDMRRHSRLQLLRAQGALAIDDLDAVGAFFDRQSASLDNLRENDTVLSDLWFRMHEKRLAGQTGAEIDDALRQRVREQFPPPAHLDFRL